MPSRPTPLQFFRSSDTLYGFEIPNSFCNHLMQSYLDLLQGYRMYFDILYVTTYVFRSPILSYSS